MHENNSFLKKYLIYVDFYGQPMWGYMHKSKAKRLAQHLNSLDVIFSWLQLHLFTTHFVLWKFFTINLIWKFLWRFQGNMFLLFPPFPLLRLLAKKYLMSWDFLKSKSQQWFPTKIIFLKCSYLLIKMSHKHIPNITTRARAIES